MMRIKLKQLLVVFVLFCTSCRPDKTLPEPNIKTPVRYMECRVYSQAYDQVTKDGRIVSYSDYYSKTSEEYDECGYCLNSNKEINDGSPYSSPYSSSYSYDFDDEEKSIRYEKNRNSRHVYNHEGKLELIYFGNKKEAQYFYDENGKLSRVTQYRTSSDIEEPSGAYFYEYSDNTQTEKRYFYEDGEIKDYYDETITTYDEEGVILKKEIYHHNTQGSDCLEHEKFYEDGNEVKDVFYEKGRVCFRTEYEYNSHNEVIQEIQYYKDGSVSYQKEWQRKYDKYGNPALIVFSFKNGDVGPSLFKKYDYQVIIYSYTYNDGTKFIAKEDFSDIFDDGKNNYDKKNTNSGANNLGDVYNGGNSSMNGGYSSEEYSGGYFGGSVANGGGVIGGNDTYGGGCISAQAKTPVKVWHDCPMCNGKGRIAYETNPPMFGQNDYQKYCSECGRSFWASNGHTHIPCTQCYGKRGYYTEEYR